MKISKETKIRVHKKIKSLEMQIEAISKDMQGKWKIRKQMTEDLFEAWSEIDETKPDANCEENVGGKE